MANLHISLNDIADEVKKSILNMDKPVKIACTAAVRIGGSNAQQYGQQDIARAGLGKKMAAAWHVKFYPGANRQAPNPPSINAAAFLYNKVPFAEVFEDGAVIHGKPFLWVPLRNAPLNVGKGHISPKRLRASGVKLFSINHAGKAPLLATKIAASRAASKKLNFNLTANALRKAHTAAALNRIGIKRKAGQVMMTVPLFFGIQAVTEKRLIHLEAISKKELDSLPDYYVANLDPESGR